MKYKRRARNTLAFLLPFCYHNKPKQAVTRWKTKVKNILPSVAILGVFVCEVSKSTQQLMGKGEG